MLSEEEINEIKERKQLEGEHLARGFCAGVVNYLGPIILILMIVIFIFNSFGLIPTDDSDLNNKERSGMRLRTDYKTGVQYFSDLNGGLVVRINPDGSPVLKK